MTWRKKLIFTVACLVWIGAVAPIAGCGVKGDPIPYVEAYPDRVSSPQPVPPPVTVPKRGDAESSGSDGGKN